ncbi:hypothetical protein GG804_18620 [Sphingomonas histidinilytica]|uniref:hypothetical protein n=1 Tax=Rhizorhabdus histidinilytica TaxID=439228 RepID=UPI001AD96ED1|nr:hypothetical protein [Rhizorhabdus histidinilytica]MBO9378785.1 hypothetical protein [Rhizorhabdus histidinilytica]
MSGQRNGSGGECRNRRPHLRVGLYWMVAAAIAIASLRLFIWVLGKSGVISDADGEFVLLIAPAHSAVDHWMAAPREPQ